jgi:16S rRNA (uracil1498-N3)-methyltransferase
VIPAIDARQVEIDGMRAEITDRGGSADHDLPRDIEAYNKKMLPRFYCPPVFYPLAAGSTIPLSEEAAHHASRVLRLRQGDALILFDGQGGEYTARVVETGKKFRVHLDEWRSRECEAPLAVTLAQALPASDKMDWIVQKAVELGATAIQPLQTKRSVVRLSGERAEKRVAHWQQVAISACEQSGRNRVPAIRTILDLGHYLAQPQGENHFILSPHQGVRLSTLPRPADAVTLLIGPEGGFEEAEEDMARSVGFQPITLGARILRTETAGLAAIASIMALWGDF